MDSFPCQPIGRQQSTRRFNTRSSSTSSVSKKNAKPEFYGVYTGEYRTPVRERVRRMRYYKSVAESLGDPDTPILSKRTFSSLLTPPRTPTRLPSIPECPGAPSKKRVSRVHQLKRRQSKTDEDILLDRKAIEIKKRMAILVGVRRQYVNATPDDNMLLGQSWGPLELAEIDSKLLAFLRASDEEDVEM
ncbi:hypothetical protein FHL15_001699 [Xylaria flabelliformis]|uniref:Uncharacterized protein n=1 Tax=Xylaria flabelliformis TaxID=2512241 RepID=A0A553IB42_9PEZI|nr:hypothetical protein FHL15_001699 [Xylaria flabelliformis]